MIGIGAFIAIFVATYYAYKTAKDYGRNAILWALIVFAVGFGIQIVIPLFIGIVIGVVMTLQGSSPEEIQNSIGGYSFILGFVCIVLSLIGMFLILKFLSRVPEDGVLSEGSPPPPPPNFNP